MNETLRTLEMMKSHDVGGVGLASAQDDTTVLVSLANLGSQRALMDMIHYVVI